MKAGVFLILTAALVLFVGTNLLWAAICPENAVKVGSPAFYYATISEAYSHAASGESVFTQGMAFTDDLDLTADKAIGLHGGYDCDFVDHSGWTTLNGTLTITGGSVTVDRLAITSIPATPVSFDSGSFPVSNDTPFDFGATSASSAPFNTAGSGRLLVAAVSWHANDSGPLGPTTGSSQSLTWTRAAEYQSNAAPNSDGGCSIWYAWAPNVLTNEVFTLGFPSHTFLGSITVYSLVNARATAAVGAVAIAANNTSNGNDVQLTITPQALKSAVIGCVGAQGGGVPGTPNATTIIDHSRNDTTIGACFEQFHLNSATTSLNPVTIGTTGNYTGNWGAVAVEILNSNATSSNKSPTIATPAAANPMLVTGVTSTLSVLGADDGDESNLTYTWSVTGKPVGATDPTYSANGTNAAKTTVATFNKAGVYQFLVVISDPAGYTVTSNVSVTVNQTPTTFTVVPSNPTVVVTTPQQFLAKLFDQFGVVVAPAPAVSWSVLGGGAGGTINASGLYNAPGVIGSDTIVAATGNLSKQVTVTIALTPSQPLLSADHTTTWNPGLNAVGGIPNYSTLHVTLSPSGGDDTAAIQNALDGAAKIATKTNPQVVKLTAGTFNISGYGLNISSYVVLRGEGPALTRVIRTDADTAVYANILIGPRYGSDKLDTPVNLTSDAIKGTQSVTVDSPANLHVGDLVHLDELNDLASESKRVWLSEPANEWFSRLDRNLSQRLEIASIVGNTVTFTTPFHMTFRVSQSAQLAPVHLLYPPVRYAGVEDLYTYGGKGGDGGGNFLIENGMYSWIKNVEAERSVGAGAGFSGCFRCVIRDSYIHTAQTIAPSSAEYMLTVDWGTSDSLIENNISWDAGKVIVFRASGGGNVVGYNYMDDAFIFYDPTFVESGLSASHQTTPHMELFEGNESFNYDSEITHGNSIDITVFRNHLTCQRRGAVTSYDNHDGTGSHPITLTDWFPRRCVATSAHNWWFNFVGNVLGFEGMPTAPQSNWMYDAFGLDAGDATIGKIWMLGNGNGNHWDEPVDPTVIATTFRHGNFDYLTRSQIWDEENTNHLIPNSLYLQSKPAFFGTNNWPWVDPSTGVTYTLPARARFDALFPQ